MYSKEEIKIIFNNCNTIIEIIECAKRLKDLNVNYGQPLFNVQELSLNRLKEVTN